MANNGPHAAGIFADMTVDGPEIGTLVIVVDRAKNLPNRKTMGKQNPYAAARLGKEARKTETDKRGGQTPRWDQELRFTVHDSPDYYNLKVSVFSEDKRTDLIGEAWVSLMDVVVPGGGKSDLWQQLNCKGKYAGEIRIELTYYDTREKPDKGETVTSVADELKQQYGSINAKVKRRPLPVNPNAPVTTPVVIPDRAPPGRAKHGPRDFSTPPRANSLPPEGSKTYNYPHSQATLFGRSPVNGHHERSTPTGASPVHPEHPPADQYYGEYDPNLGPQLYEAEPAPIPDFLPQLGPNPRQRSSMQPQARPPPRQPLPQQLRPQVNTVLAHSHSAPAVPVARPDDTAYGGSSQLHTDYPEPIPDLDYQYQHVRQRRSDVPPGWESEYGSPYADRQPYMEDELDGPPPPPVHSNSSPAVPQQYSSPHGRPYAPPVPRYGTTPPMREQYIPNSSPLQSIERARAPHTPPSQRHPPRGRSIDEYGTPLYQGSYGSTPNLTPASQTPPPHGTTSPSGRPYAARHSVADMYSSPLRPHPLSQEVSRARSPNPYGQPTAGSSPYDQDPHRQGAPPIIKPRALSPQPAPAHPSSAPPSSSRPKSLYSIQNPVRAFESCDENPLSTSRPVVQQMPRKSVSPRPFASDGGRSAVVPFSPDSFGVHNPNVLEETSPTRTGPIVGWHGQEIDPSDHLPVHSWAPEPEAKNPNKTYGTGRERDFGPRSAQGIKNTAGRVSKDTLINVRSKPQLPPEPDPQPQPSKIRAKLVKRAGLGSSPIMEPLRDHANFNPVPNPYEQQQQQYTRGFRDPSPGRGPGGQYNGYAPSVPPKVPIQQQEYGPDALSREISSIDIGTSRRPAQPAFVPVRSHRDRNTYY
ncbi:Ingression fic1 [Lecanosticta acicola]|uniref:Ingression fic1 n=1 Tax=Lecanosticta acicola TaxID=111012 RepID=A0AAI9E9N1_9PEZI|nr:Ingression fic1 [Lecanosticta acicola]